MNKNVKVVSCKKLVHFALRYPCEIIIGQLFLHFFLNDQLWQTAQVMGVEKECSHASQVCNLLVFLLCDRELAHRVNLGQIALVLDPPCAAADVHEKVLLGSQECLPHENLADRELPFLCVLVAH